MFGTNAGCKDPLAQEHEAGEGCEPVRGGEPDELDAERRHAGGVEREEREQREHERKPGEGDARRVMAGPAGPAAQSKGETPVGRGVRDRAHAEADDVGGDHADRAGQRSEEQREHDRADDADRCEADELPREWVRTHFRRFPMPGSSRPH